MTAGTETFANSRRTAFTLVEMLAVVIVMSLLAASSLPAMSAIDDAKRAAAANEIERLLISARARAMASARPTGVQLAAGSVFTVIEIAGDHAAPTTTGDVFGQPSIAIRLPDLYAGASVAAFTNGDGATGTGVVWFNHRGEPHTRAAAGDFAGAFTQDGLFTLSTARRVRVFKVSGAVAQE